MRFATSLTTLACGLAASSAFIPSNASDPVNASISIYTDGVLQAVAANPPKSASMASAMFTNGIRTLPGALFNFTELAGTTPGNLTVLMIDFAFPVCFEDISMRIRSLKSIIRPT
jgi:hypothetical protein